MADTVERVLERTRARQSAVFTAPLKSLVVVSFLAAGIAVDFLQMLIENWSYPDFWIMLHVWLRVGTALAFLTWFHGRYSSMRSIETGGISSTPAIAVAWFFAPILQLYKPYALTQEMWSSTDDDGEVDSGRSWLVLCWWIAFIAAPIVKLISMRSRGNAVTLDQSRWPTYVIGTLNIAAAILAILVIRFLDARWKRKLASQGAIRTRPEGYPVRQASSMTVVAAPIPTTFRQDAERPADALALKLSQQPPASDELFQIPVDTTGQERRFDPPLPPDMLDLVSSVDSIEKQRVPLRGTDGIVTAESRAAASAAMLAHRRAAKYAVAEAGKMKVAEILRGSSGPGRLLALCAGAYSVFIIIVAAFFALAATGERANPVLLIVMLVYVVLALLYLIPCVQLLRFSSASSGFAGQPTSGNLDAVMAPLGSLWAFSGGMVAIFLSVELLAVIAIFLLKVLSS